MCLPALGLPHQIVYVLHPLIFIFFLYVAKTVQSACSYCFINILIPKFAFQFFTHWAINAHSQVYFSVPYLLGYWCSFPSLLFNSLLVGLLLISSMAHGSTSPCSNLLTSSSSSSLRFPYHKASQLTHSVVYLLCRRKVISVLECELTLDFFHLLVSLIIVNMFIIISP